MNLLKITVLTALLPLKLFATEIPFDPYFWMEETEGAKALEWSRSRTEASKEEVKSHPLYQTIYNEALASFSMPANNDTGYFSEGYFWQFYTDDKHPLGFLRRTTPEEYRKASPSWDIIVDVDALSAKEKTDWVYKGFVFINETRVLLVLSPGGSDAKSIREFDLVTKDFVKDGIQLPVGKNTITPITDDEFLITLDTGEDSLTKSGYPRFVRRLMRGQKLEEATVVYEADRNSVSTWSYQGTHEHQNLVMIGRSIDFYRVEYFFLEAGDKLRKLPLPETAQFLGLEEDYIYMYLKDPVQLKSRTLNPNELVRINWKDSDLENAELVYATPAKSAARDFNFSGDRIYITLLEDVRAKLIELHKNAAGEWIQKLMPTPQMGNIYFSIQKTNPKYSPKLGEKEFSFLTYSDFLTPTTQYEIQLSDFKMETLKSRPAKFDASNLVAEQFFATSKDGVRIPYFIVRPKDMKYDGSNPTILNGYGGFQEVETPSYQATSGKVWHERGGVFVVANIRGGAEYGPEWHRAALREKRQTAFNDFIAVAEDLIQKKITSPRHLGIEGGSNGGLLVGSVMVQRPDLFNAVHSNVPLLDMMRYHKLLAGPSWMAEYGDPDDPKDCEFLLKYSPYHNVSAKKSYPQALFSTSTKDDRVHPAHARKMAIRMEEQGHKVFFIENEKGGHGGSQSLDEEAEAYAIEKTYFVKQLFPDSK